MVERRPYNERPPRHEYHLTEAGRDLAPVIRSLLDWGDRWVHEEPPVVMVHEPVVTTDTESGGEDDGAHGHDLDAAWICRTCGEEIARGTLTVDVRSPGWGRTGPTPAPATP